MADRQLTQKLVKEIKKHGEPALEALDAAISLGPEKGLHFKDLDLRVALEEDLGAGYNLAMLNAKEETAIEAVVTSGMFHKMVQRIIRFGLQQTPEEEYMLMNRVTPESIGECEEGYRDWGIFSDFDVHELSELQKAPLYGLAADYLDHPVGKPYGNAIAWTREALCKDPNRFIMSQLPGLITAHSRKYESLLLDSLIGYNNTWNRSGTVYDIYYGDGSGTVFTDGSSSGPWVNSIALEFTCPRDFEDLKAIWRDFTDMVHGRPEEFSETGLDVFTSLETRDSLRKLLQSTEIEEDVTCGDATTLRYRMTPQVANNLEFNPMGYRRLVSKIVERYGVTEAEAQKWMWFGHLGEFLSLVYQVRPTAQRVPLAGEEFRRRIVAMYTTYSKGYTYVRNPKKGVLVTNVEASS